MRILVAEDDELLRALLEDYLSELGHTVKSSGNGVALVQLALAERPDLIVTDLKMPEIAGDSMIAMLDMSPGLSGIPVIILSGVSGAELAGMGIPREIPVLSKPYDFAKIARAVGMVSQRKGQL